METHANSQLPFPNIAFHKQQPPRQPDAPSHLRGPLASSRARRATESGQRSGAAVSPGAPAGAGSACGADPRRQGEHPRRRWTRQPRLRGKTRSDGADCWDYFTPNKRNREQAVRACPAFGNYWAREGRQPLPRC